MSRTKVPEAVAQRFYECVDLSKKITYADLEKALEAALQQHHTDLLSDKVVEILAARLVEVPTADDRTYQNLQPDEKRSWKATADRILREELIPAALDSDG